MNERRAKRDKKRNCGFEVRPAFVQRVCLRTLISRVSPVPFHLLISGSRALSCCDIWRIDIGGEVIMSQRSKDRGRDRLSGVSACNGRGGIKFQGRQIMTLYRCSSL